ncbi:hypothetical protein HWV62_24129 [Athelia sp. TMB]|nr:hypothetical protein HWV62_20660 [Athelia sp. TMB]KAF7983146.1 hypothetical protein HWV62_24129 [Athelia sp. TMB]
MAPRRRTRSSAKKSPEGSQEPSAGSPQPVEEESNARESHGTKEDKCPACNANESPLKAAEKESWVRCDFCKTWYHWACAGNGGDLEAVDKWFCSSCMEADSTRVITLRAPARKSSRKRTQLDYANLDSGMQTDPNRWTRMLEGKNIKENHFKKMKGADVGLEWLESDDSAMREPFIVETPDGLGMKMPDADFTVDDVAEAVGEDTPVEVIDVASQANSPGWTLGKWVDYYNLEPSARDKIRNVISLEISGTKLADKVLPPRLVRELDWVEKFWPNTKKGKGHIYPKVQLYCLMGVANAWTDWHVDFAGSSVYYHVLRGSKVFYFIRPTPANLAAYERWSGTELQTNAWLGDMVDEVVKVTLTQGNTMIIPTGWIHAVYTPVDALVFGGNFLHSYNMSTQLRVRNIEIATHVPKKFRFPMFAKLCWYAADKYLRDIKAKEEFSTRVYEGIEALAGFLISEVRTIERGTEQSKKEVKDQIPADRVKDAPALARELRWRVRLAAGLESDDESLAPKAALSNGAKRKRSQAEVAVEQPARFKNFKPRIWEAVSETSGEPEKQVIQAAKPNGTAWKDQWVAWSESAPSEGVEGQADVCRRRDVTVKVRRTATGVERQKVERVLEEWVWGEGASALFPEETKHEADDSKMEIDVVESKDSIVVDKAV